MAADSAAHFPQALGAILLAAGGSSRLGQPKQLLEIDGEPLVVRQAKLLGELGFAKIVVVTGAEREAIEALLAPLPVSCVFNPDWEQGMGRSLAAGVQAMPERARAALVLLCDQWRVKTEDLVQLIEAWGVDPQAAVVSSYGQSSGPPAILPRGMFERLSKLRGDRGASKALKQWHGETREIACAHAAVDIDTIGDIPG